MASRLLNRHAAMEDADPMKATEGHLMDEMMHATEASRHAPIELLGQSKQMVEVRALIERIAETDVTVLIRGESGTGKELVARALRATSSRRDKPFIKVNCAALPAELLESEMFGFERGAFSGALQAKPGKFEFANHGTIFLDEIGEMNPSLQAKLLHVLQDGEFSRLGGQGDVRVDVRTIAATNRCLEDAVADGWFREDLFFRLNVVCITMPPLRERPQEIPGLVRHFLAKYSAHYNRPGTEISNETLDSFLTYDWPGNVRELENVIQRIVILGSESPAWNPLMPRRGTADSRERRDVSTGFVERRDVAPDRPFRQDAVNNPPRQVIPAPVTPQPPSAAASAEPGTVTKTAKDRSEPATEQPSLKVIGRSAARAAEREMILRMLNRTRWNRKEAAEILGISYKALLYKIKENRLDDPLTDLDPRGPESAVQS
jgi:transcriptional regulator with PAS, ATPase and Fis domain